MDEPRHLRALCRDCFAVGEAGRRCRQCGSPRLVASPDLTTLAIAHIDCDAFYASIEKRDQPELADLPVIIGGGRRGVVATACYVARSYGVRSAMPMFKALALCPQAVVVKPNMAKYVEVGRAIRSMMFSLTPLVEPLSIDEAFLDLSGTQRVHGASPAVALARFARLVETQIGLTISIGLSYCKFMAKIASDLDKPRGFAILGEEEAERFLAAQPIDLIWGVGRVARDKLAGDGFRLIGDLQRSSPEKLARLYGAEGLRLWNLAYGRDDRPVSVDRAIKSVSAETTFEDDVDDPRRLERILFQLSEKLSSRLKAQQVGAGSVTLKLKTHDFRVLTRTRKLPEPSRLVTRLFEAGRTLLHDNAAGRKYRLIGLGAGDLVPIEDADKGDLADPSGPRLRARQDAIDSLRSRYGRSAVIRGIAFEGDKDA